jgi:hypothetical protein
MQSGAMDRSGQRVTQVGWMLGLVGIGLWVISAAWMVAVIVILARAAR